MADVAVRTGGGYFKEKSNQKSLSLLDKYSDNVGERNGWLFNLSICVNGMHDEFSEMIGQIQHLKLEKDTC